MTTGADGAFEVTGLTLEEIGDQAARAALTVHELTLHQASLEEAYMELTADAVEYHGAPTTLQTTPTSERTAA